MYVYTYIYTYIYIYIYMRNPWRAHDLSRRPSRLVLLKTFCRGVLLSNEFGTNETVEAEFLDTMGPAQTDIHSLAGGAAVKRERVFY